MKLTDGPYFTLLYQTPDLLRKTMTDTKCGNHMKMTTESHISSKTITSGHPTFPVLPPPFNLFKLTKGMGMERAAEFLYHSRGAQNWAHHHVHYVLLTFWLWETSTDGRTTTGLLDQPILVVKNGVTGRYTTTSNHKTIPLAAASLGKYTGIAHVGPT